MPSSVDYDVRICLARCGYDPGYQPPEIMRCPNCNAPIGAVPVSMVYEWQRLLVEPAEGEEPNA